MNKFIPVQVFIFILCLAAHVPAGANDGQPMVAAIQTVAPDILSIVVQTGVIRHARQHPYQAQTGDRLLPPRDQHRWLARNGHIIGSLVGRDGQVLYDFDRYLGHDLNLNQAMQPGSYRISSPDDPNYGNRRSALEVWRKSIPTDMGRTGHWSFRWPMLHRLYLKLPDPLSAGARYRIDLTRIGLGEQVFDFRPEINLSEAVHVSQIGFRPDDPAKVGLRIVRITHYFVRRHAPPMSVAQMARTRQWSVSGIPACEFTPTMGSVGVVFCARRSPGQPPTWLRGGVAALGGAKPAY